MQVGGGLLQPMRPSDTSEANPALPSPSPPPPTSPRPTVTAKQAFHETNREGGEQGEGDVPRPLSPPAGQGPTSATAAPPRATSTPSHEPSPAASMATASRTVYQALYDFEGSDPSELSFREGSVLVALPNTGTKPSSEWVMVVEEGGDGEGGRGERSGWAPLNYLELIEGGEGGGEGEEGKEEGGEGEGEEAEKKEQEKAEGLGESEYIHT